MAKIIKIPYLPREYFIPLHESKKRWSVIVAHRRSGKSTASFNHLQRDALQTKNSRYAFILPTYKMAKNVIWDIAKEYSKIIPKVEYNEAELTIKYPNQSRITLYGADNPDSLRGIGLWGVVFDEYSQQPSNIFSEIIRPALADHNGYAIWIGTPKGKNEFWKLYEKAKNEETWYSSHLTVDDTKIISKEELDDARKVMTEDEFLQEWYCSFEAAIKGAYYAEQLSEARKERITKVPYDETLLVNTWCDLGIGDAFAIGYFQGEGKEERMIDYDEFSGESLGDAIKRMKEKPYHYGEHYAPHDIEVRELGTGKTRLEIAKSLGINYNVIPKISVEDGINAARMKFSQLWIDEDKCARFLHCLSLYHKEWDDKRGEFRNKPYHDFTSHAADMLRYWATTKEKPLETFTQYRPKWISNKREIKTFSQFRPRLK